MSPTPVGIDIAKTVFQVHYVDEETGEIVNRSIKRQKFLEHFANRYALSASKRAEALTTGRENSRRWGMR